MLLAFLFWAVPVTYMCAFYPTNKFRQTPYISDYVDDKFGQSTALTYDSYFLVQARKSLQGRLQVVMSFNRFVVVYFSLSYGRVSVWGFKIRRVTNKRGGVLCFSCSIEKGLQ